MDKIYLLTSDNYLDSLVTEHFATNEEELIEILKLEIDHFSWRLLRYEIDWKNEMIKFVYSQYYDNEEERGTYHFYTIPKFNL